MNRDRSNTVNASSCYAKASDMTKFYEQSPCLDGKMERSPFDVMMLQKYNTCQTSLEGKDIVVEKYGNVHNKLAEEIKHLRNYLKK